MKFIRVSAGILCSASKSVVQPSRMNMLIYLFAASVMCPCQTTVTVQHSNILHISYLRRLLFTYSCILFTCLLHTYLRRLVSCVMLKFLSMVLSWVFSVTSSVKMAEPELNVDSLISRLLEGWLRFTVVILCWLVRDGIKPISNVVW